MSEDDGYFGVIRNNFSDPYVRLVVAIIAVAIEDCMVNPDSVSTCHRRQEAQKKKDAIDFLKSPRFEYFVNLADLNLNVALIRQTLRHEFEKRDEVVKILSETFLKEHKKRRKRITFTSQPLPEL